MLFPSLNKRNIKRNARRKQNDDEQFHSLHPIRSDNIYVNGRMYAMIPRRKLDVRAKYPKNYTPRYNEVFDNYRIGNDDMPGPGFKTVLMDDSGDSDRNETSHIFVLTSTVTGNPEQLALAVRDVPVNEEGDRKFTYCKYAYPDLTMEAMRRIAATEPDIYVRTVDRSSIEDPRKGSVVYRQTADQLIQDMLATDPYSTFDVLADRTNKMSQDILENLCTDDRIDDARMIEDDTDPRMHVADFVSGSVKLAVDQEIPIEWRWGYLRAIEDRVKKPKTGD